MRKGPFWTLAVLITLTSAVYQRMTGPSYPARVKTVVEGREMRFRLPRTADSAANAAVELRAPAPAEGYLEYTRYRANEPWTREPLARRGDTLVGYLPKQPSAGKLAYRVHLVSGGKDTEVGGDTPIIIRFKDRVPLGLLIVHVIVMFAGMLAAAAAGLAALDKKRDPRPFVLWAATLIFIGGFVLGPLVQKYAFGTFWSGFPAGTDLTDNKTAFMFLFWIVALAAGRKGRPARLAVVVASVVTLVIYLIPHSLFGSEIDYTKLK
ncbi:MAG TPA: hypothetical protein VMS75_10545 [Terriglobales bacterium]|nr:hypothetical protein [Terriglobales bacterium]